MKKLLISFALLSSCYNGTERASGRSQTDPPVSIVGNSYRGTWTSYSAGVSGALEATFDEGGLVHVEVFDSPCMGETEGAYSYGPLHGSVGDLAVTLQHGAGNWQVDGFVTDGGLSATFQVTGGACAGESGFISMQLFVALDDPPAPKEGKLVEVLEVSEDGTLEYVNLETGVYVEVTQ